MLNEEHRKIRQRAVERGSGWGEAQPPHDETAASSPIRPQGFTDRSAARHRQAALGGLRPVAVRQLVTAA